MNPQRIPNSKRQRLTTSNGTVLERAYVFMPPESWAALQRLSISTHRSNSQIVEELINSASNGNAAQGGDQIKEIYDQASIIKV